MTTRQTDGHGSWGSRWRPWPRCRRPVRTDRRRRRRRPGRAARTNLRLHPDNPRYFLFRGKPTVVITSGEHYGAVLNLDFDYRRYFDTLKADGLNGTRIFSGTYVETGGNFGIAANTLDPAKGRFISPWARSTTAGYADGGAKFDLTRFDEAYVTRLRDVLQEASARGIIVELVLFCPLYEDSMWAVSPMNPANNVNGFPPIRRRGRPHPGQERSAAGRAGSRGAPPRRGGRRLRQRLHRDLQRALRDAGAGRLAAAHDDGRGRCGGEAAAAGPALAERRQPGHSASSIRTRPSRSSTSTTPRRPTRSPGTRTSGA